MTRTQGLKLHADLLDEAPHGSPDFPGCGWQRTARWMVVGTRQSVASYRRLHLAAELACLAALTAMPACCAKSQQQLAVEGERVDPVWAMATNRNGQEEVRRIEVVGEPCTNPLFRRLGITEVAHPVCRFGCAASIAWANERLSIGRLAGLGTQIDLLLQVLSLPVSWSVLHGIAEIKTPLFKLSLSTPFTPDKRLLLFHGQAEVAEGARGIGHPYQTKRRGSLPIIDQ